MQETVTLVIPCFNEAARLDGAAFLELRAARPSLRLVFVDDGSSDGTGAMLDGLAASAAPGAVTVVRLGENQGKAEAVRRGLLSALDAGAGLVGYADADLATPPAELLRLVDDMIAAPVAVLLGARVRLLGTAIERRAARHYLGRIFATLASVALGVPVYDTQCGAKLFRRSELLRAALATPFRSRWGFDVELLERLLVGVGGLPPVTAAEMRELPLRAWRDVRGSKMGPTAMVRAGLQLLGLLLRSFGRRR
jgi:glycosyltransferase involved in cell wall biosynthesis